MKILEKRKLGFLNIGKKGSVKDGYLRKDFTWDNARTRRGINPIVQNMNFRREINSDVKEVVNND